MSENQQSLPSIHGWSPQFDDLVISNRVPSMIAGNLTFNAMSIPFSLNSDRKRWTVARRKFCVVVIRVNVLCNA